MIYQPSQNKYFFYHRQKRNNERENLSIKQNLYEGISSPMAI